MTTTAIERPVTPMTSPPLTSAEQYRQLAHRGAMRNQTLLGKCPRCGGNIVRVTGAPGVAQHAQCLQCSRDFCCPRSL